MNLLKTLSISYYIGMALLFIGIILQLNHADYGVYLLIAGIIPLYTVRVFNFTKGKTENKRLNGILLISATFLLAAVAAAFIGYGFWIVMIMISAALDFYVSFRRYK